MDVQAIVGLALVVAGAAFALYQVPKWQVRRVEDLDRRIELETDARKTLAQILGGGFFLAALFFTWNNLQVAQEGQITERFTRAIEQLGDMRLEIRLGGIYALERIAKDSPKDHWTIMEVLTAFVRERIPWEESRTDELKTEVRVRIPGTKDKPRTWTVRRPPQGADVQAILRVLGRRTRTFEGQDQRLNLTHIDLRGADLSGTHLERTALVETHLERAHFAETHLEESVLWRAHLEEATLYLTHLERADLTGAHLERAEFELAHLEGAKLSEAYLEGARLLGVHLEGASLDGASLKGADVWGAHFEGANLYRANLQGVKQATKINVITMRMLPAEVTEFLTAVNFKDANLKEAILTGADLRGAILEKASLLGASLKSVNLKEASLRDADLSWAHLEGANLEGADLERANIESAYLEGANLKKASLKDANLWGAHLEGVNLSDTKSLTKKQIESALTDENTKLPDYLKEPEQPNPGAQ